MKTIFLVAVLCLLGTSEIYNFIIYGDGRGELVANIGVNIYEVVPPED